MAAALIQSPDKHWWDNNPLDLLPITSLWGQAGKKIDPHVKDVPVVGPAVTAADTVVSSADALGHLATDLINPNWWIRVGEFLIGSVLIVVGVGGMLKAGDKARSVARTSERGARVAYSVTPAGSRVNRAARSTARTARRARA